MGLGLVASSRTSLAGTTHVLSVGTWAPFGTLLIKIVILRLEDLWIAALVIYPLELHGL